MAKDKAPGIDGFPAEFYVTFWDVLGADLVDVFNFFFFFFFVFYIFLLIGSYIHFFSNKHSSHKQADTVHHIFTYAPHSSS